MSMTRSHLEGSPKKIKLDHASSNTGDMVAEYFPREIQLDPASNTDDMVRESSHTKIQLDRAKVKEHFDRIGHFRVLVIGRSNAGKTTLLQRVCNTTELPEIYNSKGEKVNDHILPRHRTLLMRDNS